MADPASPISDEVVIQNLLIRLNDAWQNLRGDAMADALGECFAEDVVMRGPGFLFLGKGREFAVRSYADFVSQCEIKAFTLEDPAVDVAEDIATAQYKWQMTYVLDGQEYTEQGHDVFVLGRRGGRWLVVWRALLAS